MDPKRGESHLNLFQSSPVEASVIHRRDPNVSSESRPGTAEVHHGKKSWDGKTNESHFNLSSEDLPTEVSFKAGRRMGVNTNASHFSFGAEDAEAPDVVSRRNPNAQTEPAHYQRPSSRYFLSSSF